MPDHPNIEQRKFAFCEKLAENSLSRLIVECSSCHRYMAACCQHSCLGGDLYRRHTDRNPTCHHNQLVFSDGACSHNGAASAKAGLGITIGNHEEYSWSIPVDEVMDPGAPRTSQRAELLAVIKSLEILEQVHQLNEARGDDHGRDPLRHRQVNRSTYIVATDSEYTVKGITEWFPDWRDKGFRTATGKKPKNLDLFLKLDDCVTRLELDRVAVGFWYIPRTYNERADNLAKRATRV